MSVSSSRPADDEIHALAEIIRTEFSVGEQHEPLSEPEALRAASVVASRLHGLGYEVVELYDGDPWTAEAASDDSG